MSILQTTVNIYHRSKLCTLEHVILAGLRVSSSVGNDLKATAFDTITFLLFTLLLLLLFPLALIYLQAPHILPSSSLFSQFLCHFYGTNPLTLALVIRTYAEILIIQLMLFNSHSPFPPYKLNLRALQDYSFLSSCIQKCAMLI